MLLLHHDVTSPTAALAVLRLEVLASEGLPVAFWGIDVLGLATTVPVTLDQLAELERVRDDLAALGLPARRPRSRPPTLACHAIGGLADAHGLGASWRRLCLEAYWQHGSDLADHSVLRGLAEAAGLPWGDVAALLDDGAALRALRAAMAARRLGGVGGVPVLEVDGTLVPADLPDDDLRRLAAL